MIDVLVKDQERLPKQNLQICDPARPTTCVLMGAGRHRWEFMLSVAPVPVTGGTGFPLNALAVF